MCVFFSISSVFFYSGNSSTYFKVCVDLCEKKSGSTRCQAVSILEYNINWNSKSAERAKTFGFLKEERFTSEHRRPGLSINLNQWTFMTCK